MSDQDDITAAIAGIRSRLDTLASINAANMRVLGGPQERYHQIVEKPTQRWGSSKRRLMN